MSDAIHDYLDTLEHGHSDAVYCAECTWCCNYAYYKGPRCFHPHAVYTVQTPIALKTDYQTCAERNAYNDCQDFEAGPDVMHREYLALLATQAQEETDYHAAVHHWCMTHVPRLNRWCPRLSKTLARLAIGLTDFSQ